MTAEQEDDRLDDVIRQIDSLIKIKGWVERERQAMGRKIYPSGASIEKISMSLVNTRHPAKISHIIKYRTLKPFNLDCKIAWIQTKT